MTWADDLIGLGIPTNWTTLEVGTSGRGLPSPMLWPGEAMELAYRLDPPADNLDAYTELLSADVGDRAEIIAALGRLSESEGVDRGPEVRKWRLLEVRRQLRELPNDPIQALVALTELWAAWGYPSDSPHVVQGLGNDMRPEAYFTSENLEALVTLHRNWVLDELRRLLDTPDRMRRETQ